MAQIFHPSTNTISRLTLFSALAWIVFLAWILLKLQRSSYLTQANVEREQPVQFSHKHHVSDDGIDCRYCHTSVEASPFAGIPSTEICMHCHSELFRNSSYLAPVRDSFRNNVSIRWNRVHQLAGFVYFDHSIHVNKGVGCSSCHGRVDQMPQVRQVASLQMEWCLECHRQPEFYLRPREDIYVMDWKPPPNQREAGLHLAEQYHIRSVAELTSCSTCHR